MKKSLETKINVVGNQIIMEVNGDNYPRFELIFNGNKYRTNEPHKEFVEILPAIHFKIERSIDNKEIEELHDKYLNSSSLIKKTENLIRLSIKQSQFNKQIVKYIIDNRNKRDSVSINTGIGINKKNVYKNDGNRVGHERLRIEDYIDYEIQKERKYVDTTKIFYPSSLGGGAGKCIIWDIFQSLDLMNTFNDDYRPLSISEMFEASSENSSLLNECSKFKRCRGLLDKFNNDTYIEEPDKTSFYDDIQLEEIDGFYIPHEGKHRVCIAKRFNIPMIYAQVNKAINIRQKDKLKNGLKYVFQNQHYDPKRTLEMCYKIFKNMGIDKEQVIYILENGLNNKDLIEYIEKATGKSLTQLAKEIGR